jgi:hypothetical protein
LAQDDYAIWLGEVEAATEELRAMLKPCKLPVKAVKVSAKQVDSPDVFEVLA